MLQVRNLDVSYGSIAAVRGIDLDIAAGEIVALIGANGAGKTTIARAIAGLLPYRGEITYDDRLLKPNTAERNLRLGIALVPEGRGILGRMTVEENLLMGIYTRSDQAQAADDLAEVQARFPILATDATRWRACSAAASSRCWPSHARYCPDRNCCCLTNRRSALRPK